MEKIFCLIKRKLKNTTDFTGNLIVTEREREMLRGVKKVRADCKTFLPRTAGARSGLTLLSLSQTASLHMVTAFTGSTDYRLEAIELHVHMWIRESHKIAEQGHKLPEQSGAQ